MSSGYSAHLLKRGVHFASDCIKHKQAAFGRVQIGQESNKTILEEIVERFQSPAAIFTLGLTFFCFFILTTAVDYSIDVVVTNLAIVEDTDGSRITLPAGNEPDEPLDKTALLDDFEGKVPVLETVPMKPITSKLRTTFRHLSSVGGFRARFRGLRMAAFYHIVYAAFSALMNMIFGVFALGPIGFWLGQTIAAICSCNAHAAWTHMSISHPSEKGFFKHFLPRSVAKQLMLPTLRLHMAFGVMHALTMGSAYLAVSMFENSSLPRHLSLNLFFLPIFVALATSLLAVLPAYIALIRAEASLLPEDMTAVVPFDRTFGGRFLEEFTPRCATIFKNLSMRGAWTLFDRDTYKRVVKIQVKLMMIIFAIFGVFLGIFLTEGYIIAGGHHNLHKLAEYIREHQNRM